MKTINITKFAAIACLALQAVAAEPTAPPSRSDMHDAQFTQTVAATEDMRSVLETTDQQVQRTYAALSDHLDQLSEYGAQMGALRQKVVEAANQYVASPTPATRANLVEELGRFSAEGARLAADAQGAENGFRDTLDALRDQVAEDVARVRKERARVETIGKDLRQKQLELESEIERLARALEAYPVDDLPEELVMKLDEVLILRDDVQNIAAMWSGHEEMMADYDANITEFATGMAAIERQSRRNAMMMGSLKRNFELTGLVVSGAARWELLDGTYAQLGDMFERYGTVAADLDGITQDVRQTGSTGMRSLAGNRPPREAIAMPNSAADNVRAFLEQRRNRGNQTAAMDNNN